MTHLSIIPPDVGLIILYDLLDRVAVRDKESLAYLEGEFQFSPRLLPDPAFFLKPDVNRNAVDGNIETLGLAMRAEDWGIRV